MKSITKLDFPLLPPLIAIEKVGTLIISYRFCILVHGFFSVMIPSIVKKNLSLLNLGVRNRATTYHYAITLEKYANN